MRISDWSSDVCSSDLGDRLRELDHLRHIVGGDRPMRRLADIERLHVGPIGLGIVARDVPYRLGPLRRRLFRSEEHTSELQSLMRISYAVFCLKKKTKQKKKTKNNYTSKTKYTKKLYKNQLTILHKSTMKTTIILQSS